MSGTGMYMNVKLHKRDGTFIKEVQIVNFYVPPDLVISDGHYYLHDSALDYRECISAVAADIIA